MRIIIASAICLSVFAYAAYGAGHDSRFKAEVRDGLDIRHARDTAHIPTAHGALGGEVYESATAAKSDDFKLYIPRHNYIRAGGGITIPWLSGAANSPLGHADIGNGYAVRLGLGRNFTPFARGEIDFQYNDFGFDRDTTWAFAPGDMYARSHAIGGMLYFDFLQRYHTTGDVLRRRSFIPFIGLGVNVGRVETSDAQTSFGWIYGHKSAFIAPRAELGLTVMLSDAIGVDVAYQYSAMVSNKFGFGGGQKDSAASISNIMASIRYNF
ncbi:MAG: hypothetical protein FWF34_00660 [Alphaproteobacteria bacterium]|nr:hypothetical protein [Alphaproteobacteria bacterium]MCL2889757.1 hypothetical protein [Alphaproteobacteria bacterium]